MRAFALLVLAGCAAADPSPVRESGPPPPFTAEQIRSAHPDGTVIRMRVRQADGTELVTHTRFVDGDDEAVTVTSGNEQQPGVAPPRPQRARATWPELRDHAAFPPDRTTRERAACTVEAGTYDCWLYTVRSADGPGGAVSHYWFALDKPGPPVLLVREQAGREVVRMELLEYRPGG